MNLFVIIELAFIIIYSFAILKNYFKRNTLKKEGPFVVLKNYNLSSTIYIIILAIIVCIYMICVDQSSILEKVLSSIIILLLILNILINSKVLLTHGSLYYMYYNVPYNSINLVTYKEKSKDSYLIKLQFEKTAFNFSLKKESFDDFYEVLKYKKVKVEKA
ncbi:hypothetical protein [Clostridium sp. Ade.TY]|uniref:hypothetical protein n=1 Tax=Clostridium sp. Ade.TY TaxID=1391647 RepID=UPI000407ECC3|nr:hypothetical protein [Clostridium sp. Ade.TY]